MSSLAHLEARARCEAGIMVDVADVVVVGGAVMGSAVAYFLSVDPSFKGRVIVLEKDPSYARAASSLSTSGVRQQFSSAVNVRLSRFSVGFLNEIERHLSVADEGSGVVFHNHGYLYLGDAQAVTAFEESHRVQRGLGVDVSLLDKEELAHRFPWLTLDDVEIGSFGGEGEGWIDGYMLMNAFKRRARANGVEYRYVGAKDIAFANGHVTGVICSNGEAIAAKHVVNAAGGAGPDIARMLGIELPVRNVKQVVFAFESPFLTDRMPYIFTPDGLFCRPEGRDYIAGLKIADDAPEAHDFEVDYELFESEVWPRLASRVSAFENARLRSAWAGHYDMNLFDHNAIVGSVPERQGFYLANGFSGHGLMHAPGIGHALAELIVHGQYRTLDLTDLSIERISRDQPISEKIQY